MSRSDWSPPPRPRPRPRPLALRARTLLYFTFLYGLPPAPSPALCAWPSPSPDPPPPPVSPPCLSPGLSPEEASLSPLSPLSAPHATEPAADERAKRSSGPHADTQPQGGVSARRVRTGATTLNIRGAVRDAIGDAGAAPAATARHQHASRIDAFVIRPAARPHLPPTDAQPAPRAQPALSQDSVREVVVSGGARARIPCDLRDVTDVRWYKDNELVSLGDVGASVGGEGAYAGVEGGALLVRRAARGDAALWRCAGTDRAGRQRHGQPNRLLIYERVRAVYLAVDGRRLDAGNTWVPVRDQTALEVRCVAEGGVPAPALSWRLVSLEAGAGREHRTYLRVHSTNHSLEGVSWSRAEVTAARELHNATLRCTAAQRAPQDATSTAPNTAANTAANTDTDTAAPLAAQLEIRVTYPPSFVISRWPGFGVSLRAGGAAALRCDVDANPPARAWWHSDAADSSSPAPLGVGAGGGEGAAGVGAGAARGSATLRWGALRATHAGWYRCRATWLDAEYSSIGYYLNVIAAPEGGEGGGGEEQAGAEGGEAGGEDEGAEDQPEHQRVDVAVGGHVQLHCPKGSVGCWWRRVVGNVSADEGPGPGPGPGLGPGPDTAWAPAGTTRAHGVLGIKDAMYEEGGEYRCLGARAPDMGRIRELKRVTLRVTGGATATALSAHPSGGGWRLECGACGRGVRVLWVRPGGGPGPGVGGGPGAVGGPHTQPAALTPDLAQHCWRAALHVMEPDEVLCVAVSSGGGAVAVFPARPPAPAPAPPSPAPARQSVRAGAGAGAAVTHTVAQAVTLAVALSVAARL